MIWFLIIFSAMFFLPGDGRTIWESSSGGILFSLFISYKLSEKIHWSAGVLFWIICFSAFFSESQPFSDSLMQSAWLIKLNGISTYNILTNDWEMRSMGLASIAPLFLFTLIFLTFSSKIFEDLFLALFWISVINALVIIVRALFLGKSYALFSNGAMDASFIACFLPAALYWKKWWCASFMILGILFTKASTGLFAIAIALSIFGLSWMFALIPIIGIGYFYLGDQLLYSNGRFVVWQRTMEFLKDSKNLFTGIGTGSFFVWGSGVQISYLPAGKYDIFTWAHNDWLQILFENGILGLTAILIFYFYMLRMAFLKRNFLLHSLLIYGFIGLTQMPLHLFLLQINGLCLVSLSRTKQI